jgi:hypothetical protein
MPGNDATGTRARPDALGPRTRSDALGPRTRPETGAPKRRPDPRPTRVVLGLSTFAAMSIVTAGLVRFPVATSSDADLAAVAPDPTQGAPQKVVHRVKYVQLKPGQKAPAGAKVIKGAQPTPRVVVRTIPAPRQVASAPRPRPVARTRQSGR